MSGLKRRNARQQATEQEQLNPVVHQPIAGQQGNAAAQAGNPGQDLGVETPTLSAFEEIAAARGNADQLSRPDARTRGARPQLFAGTDEQYTKDEDLDGIDRAHAFKQITTPEAFPRIGPVPDRRSHPHYKVFEKRVLQLANRVPEGENVFAEARKLWDLLFDGVEQTQAEMLDEDIYSNVERGWVRLNEAKFSTAMGGLTNAVERFGVLAAGDFDKAGSYGFWSHSAGRALAESVTDLTLETSGLGFIFDGITSLDGGVDMHLWASLSQQYAKMVGERLEDNELHVCVGPNVRDDNIFAIIENPALTNALPNDLNLADKARYHAAATKQDESWDRTVRGGDFPGTAYSGDSLADAKRAATQHLTAQAVNHAEEVGEAEQG